MSDSSRCPEALDLDRLPPTTAADVAALRRARLRPGLTTAAYLRALSRLPAPAAPRPRRHSFGEPFRLD